jgi:cation diffusion facilitator family transporter
MPDTNHKYRAASAEIIKTAKLSIYSNTLLLLMKLAVGFLMGSISVLSEALHSGIDLIAAIIANYSIRTAAKPADDMHKFGHGKYENISGTIEALLIFIISIVIMLEAWNKIQTGGKVEYLGAGMVVMGISAVVNYFISRKLMKVARKTESIALEADAFHLSTDVYTSLGVFAGLVLIQLTGMPVFDPVMAIIVALIILRAAYKLTKRSLYGLMDAKLSDSEECIIKEIITGHFSEYVEYHNLRTRMSGAERFVDLHLVFPRNKPVVEAHEFCDHLEKDIMKKIPNLSITIHIEPCRDDCVICQKLGVCNMADKRTTKS